MRFNESTHENHIQRYVGINKDKNQKNSKLLKCYLIISVRFMKFMEVILNFLCHLTKVTVFNVII